MRLREFAPSKKPVIVEAARIQHAEDWIFWEGSAGAKRTLAALKSLAEQGHKDVTIKWDGCIHPDSVVETNLGKARIEDVIDKVNEKSEDVSVLQFNFETQTVEMLPVLNAVKKHGSKRWVRVELDNGDTLTLTEDHKVYTTNRGWVEAGNLSEDDNIKDINKHVKVKKVTQLEEQYLQCDITTPTENFFVFNDDVGYLIHNSPAVIFGRDAQGRFVFTDKSGFTARGYDGKAKSADGLESMLKNRPGYQRNPEGYGGFISAMKGAFDAFEQAVPANHRGFFKGDMLYFNTPPVKNQDFVFTPNVVEYRIAVDSDLGQRIAKSTAGVVIHREVDIDGTESPLQNTDIFQGHTVLVMPPVTVESPADVPVDQLRSLADIIRKNAAAIDQFLNPEDLRQQQITDLPRLLYAYLNSKVDTGLHNLGADFEQWLATARVSERKKANVLAHIEQHQPAFRAMWDTISATMSVKDHIIKQFDAQSEIRQSIGGAAGGEGYVLAHPEGDIKLVPREFFTRANRAMQR